MTSTTQPPQLERTLLSRHVSMIAIGGIIGAIGGTPDFANAGFTVNGSKIVYGSTINALINFAIVAAVIYFVVVVPMQALARRRGADADTPAPSDETVLLTDIRDLLRTQGTPRA